MITFECLEARELMDAAPIYGPMPTSSAPSDSDAAVPVIIEQTNGADVSSIDLSSLVGPVPQAQVAAVNAARKILSSDVVVVEAVSGAPSAPTNLAFGTYDATTRRLPMSWDASEDAAGYRVEYSTDERATWKLAGYTFGETTERLARDVDTAKTYYFRVSAINERGQSDWLEGSWNYADASKPKPPTNFTSTTYEPSSGALTLVWNASTSTDVVYYPSEYSTDGGATWKLAGNVKANRTYRTATKVYLPTEFRVCSLDSDGERSDWVYYSFNPYEWKVL